LSWEVTASSNGPPTDEGGHANTAVLHFGVTEPRDGFISTKVSKAKGIPDLTKLNGVRGRKDLPHEWQKGNSEQRRSLGQ
jgi:hypothetical protein